VSLSILTSTDEQFLSVDESPPAANEHGVCAVICRTAFDPTSCCCRGRSRGKSRWRRPRDVGRGGGSFSGPRYVVLLYYRCESCFGAWWLRCPRRVRGLGVSYVFGRRHDRCWAGGRSRS